MTELPDNVDLKWIGTTLIELRDGFAAMRREFRDLAVDVRRLREDFDVMTMRLIRIEATVTALRDDVRQLWEAHGDLRRRLEILESK